MSESQSESFCAQCHKQYQMNGRHQKHHSKSIDKHSFKVIDLNDAESKFYKLQKQIIALKQENEKKMQTISTLKKQLIGQRPRKSSIELQMQQNKKQFQQLKSTLLTFGNDGLQGQPQIKHENKSSVSTQLIITSLQKRLKEYKIQLLKLIEKVQLRQKSTQWMYQFIDSFLKMVHEINKTGRYGDPLVLKELSIKKRTKIAWKYLKDLLEKIVNTP